MPMHDSATAYQNRLSSLTDEELRNEFTLMWKMAGGGDFASILPNCRVSKRDLLVSEAAYRWTREQDKKEAKEVPLRRCLRCGERVRVEGETVLCDGVVSKLVPLSVHVPVTPTILGYPVRFVDPPSPSSTDRVSTPACGRTNCTGCLDCEG